MGLTLCVSVTTVWYVCLGFVLETAVCDMSVYAFVLCGRPKLAWVYGPPCPGVANWRDIYGSLLHTYFGRMFMPWHVRRVWLAQ